MIKIPHPQSIKSIAARTFSATRPAFETLALATLITSVSIIGNAVAGDAKIVDAKVTPSGDGVYNISVTLEHADEGWDHYADRWDVLDENGELLGSRVLAHPHVNEQPFTRSLRVKIPATVKTITIVAADSVHGDNEETFSVELPST